VDQQVMREVWSLTPQNMKMLLAETPTEKACLFQVPSPFLTKTIFCNFQLQQIVFSMPGKDGLFIHSQYS
jgi:hypothetical protein